MKITRVVRKKNNASLSSIFIDGAYAFSASDESRVTFNLKEGREIQPEEIVKIHAEENRRRALDYSFRLLGGRARSKHELFTMLRQKEFPVEVATTTIERLKELGYVDDAHFARDWAAERKEKGFGPERISAELRKKGIAAEIVRDTLSSGGSPDEERHVLKELALRKLAKMRKLAPQVSSRRLAGFLARKGYSIDLVRGVISELFKKRLDDQEDAS